MTDGQKTRTCSDLNSCGTISQKPVTTSSCEEETPDDEESSWWLWVIILVILIVIVVSVILALMSIKKSREGNVSRMEKV